MTESTKHLAHLALENIQGYQQSQTILCMCVCSLCLKIGCYCIYYILMSLILREDSSKSKKLVSQMQAAQTFE